MDYQCIVVYTVIDISPPRSGQSPTFSDGCVNWFKNKIKRAVAVYLTSLKLTPNNAFVYAKLASLNYQQGLIDIAIDTYKKAIEIQPNFPDAYCNLANALKEKGNVSEAEEFYNSALNLCPVHVHTLNNLANVKREQGKIEEAVILYMKAIEVSPNFAAAHSNLASLLQQQGKLYEALRHYEQAICIQPKFADAYSNMGSTLRELQDLKGAFVCFSKAIELNPSFPDAHCNLGSIYKDMGNVTEAIVCYENALKLKPNFPDAYFNLAYCLQIVCDWNDYDERMKYIVSVVEFQMNSDKLYSVHPHHSMLYPLTNKLRKDIAYRQAIWYKEKVNMQTRVKFKYTRNIKGRIRIGYVSSDFGNHPSSHLMQSIPGLHESKRYEIFCYALNFNDETTFREKIVEESEHFIDISSDKDNSKAAERINNDQIDILVNMNGYTKGARNEIFALRPAPIQVMWLGYPGTSGADYMDYIITDNVSTPMKSEHDFSEKFAYMPNTYFIGDHKNMFSHLKEKYFVMTEQCKYSENSVILNVASDLQNSIPIRETIISIKYYDKKPLTLIEREIDIPQFYIDALENQMEKQVYYNEMPICNGVFINSCNKKIGSGEIKLQGTLIYTSRTQYGLPNNAVIYCNFNQLYKMDPTILKIWVQILKKVPNSYLWLLNFPAAGKPNICKFADILGICTERILFSDIACKEEHVRRGQLADICLDTPLCNGHTTTMDLLWTGTPVVTLPGDTLASRVAASQLNAMNCQELIAQSKQDYIDIAVKLGTDLNYRKYIRAKVSNARLETSLFDCDQYTRGLEALYEKMWSRYESGQTPDHIKAVSDE